MSTGVNSAVALRTLVLGSLLSELVIHYLLIVSRLQVVSCKLAMEILLGAGAGGTGQGGRV